MRQLHNVSISFKSRSFSSLIVIGLLCLLLSGCFDLEAKVEINKDGSGIVSYAFITDPSLAGAFTDSNIFTHGEKIRNYIKDGMFYHEGSQSFSSLSELNLQDERLSLTGSRYEHTIFLDKQRKNEGEQALSILLLKGHFIVYSLKLPSPITEAYPVTIRGIEIFPNFTSNIANWKIPMDLMLSAEKLIFRADIKGSFNDEATNTRSLVVPITSIIDGDTLEVVYNNEKKQVRLIGIDTPEVVVNEKTRHDADEWGITIQKVLEMGEVATDYVINIIKVGDKVRLGFDDAGSKIDPYDRLLCYVFLENDIFLNAELLRKGFARFSTHDWKDGREYQEKKYYADFEKITEEARRNKAGFWTIWDRSEFAFQIKPPIIIAIDGLAIEEIGPLGIEILKPFLGREPDKYLGASLVMSSGIKSMNAEIKAYTWKRDPAYTDTQVQDLKKNIMQAYEVAKNDNRPLVIVAHSWGTVLAYKALRELQARVVINSFITMGSPLDLKTRSVPASVEDFMYVEKIKEGLPAVNQKPENVKGNWVNLWAKGDVFSNMIAVADENIQIDKGSAPWFPSLVSTKRWHREYFMPADAAWMELKDNIMFNIPITPTKITQWVDQVIPEKIKEGIKQSGYRAFSIFKHIAKS